MTYVSYKWTDGERCVVFNTLGEVEEQIKNHGGHYKLVYDFRPGREEAYCMIGAAKASDRWKNYKY